jgi:hypothetical protein
MWHFLWDVAKFAFVLMAIRIFAPALFTTFNDLFDKVKEALSAVKLK